MSTKEEAQNKNNSLKSRLLLSLNAFGNDVFYAVVSVYFVNFITSQLFDTGDDHLNAILISATTFIIMLIRIIIQFLDPIIGNMIDRTKTRIGRFVPWVIAGGTGSSIILLILFTNMGGLSNTNPWLFVAIFSILYFVMMLFFAFRDIGFWSMIPALTLNANERNTTVAFARVGATSGQIIVGIVIMPLVLALSLSNKDVNGDLNGWFWFGFIACLISMLSSIIICFGGKELNHKIRENKDDTKGVKEIFQVLFRNDQLLYVFLGYFLYTISNKIISSMTVYYFQYIVGQPSGYSIVQFINMIFAIAATASFPFLAKRFTRKQLFATCMSTIFVGIALYTVSGASLLLVIISNILIVLPNPVVFMIFFMTFTDAIEYGQLKTGHRDESLISSTRAMASNIGSAIATGYVGQAAVVATMTTGATAASITSENIIAFKIMMFLIPAIIFGIATFAYLKKVTLSQERHKEIVEKLENKTE